MKKLLVFILVFVGFLTFGIPVVKAELVSKSDGYQLVVDAESKKYISSIDSYSGNGFSDEQKKLLDRANPNADKDLYSNFVLSAVWIYLTQDGTIEEGSMTKDNEFFNIFSAFDNNPKYPQFNGAIPPNGAIP